MKLLVFAIVLLIGIAIGLMIGIRIALAVAKSKKLNEKKFYNYYKFIIKFFEKYLAGANLFPQIKEYEKIAIYGCAEMGILAKRILESKGITTEYFIDRRMAGEIIDGVEVRSIDREIDDVDWVIVTPFIYYNEIEKKITYDRNKTKVIPIDEVIEGKIDFIEHTN